MTNINIYLNSPLRVSESFMFSNISSWFCPLRWQRNDLWKNTTAHILMKVLKIIYHSHSNYTVGIFQVVLRKTNGWWQVLGCPCWPCPEMPHGTHFWGKKTLLPFCLIYLRKWCDFSHFILLTFFRYTSFMQCSCLLVQASKNKHISYINTFIFLSTWFFSTNFLEIWGCLSQMINNNVKICIS